MHIINTRCMQSIFFLQKYDNNHHEKLSLLYKHTWAHLIIFLLTMFYIPKNMNEKLIAFLKKTFVVNVLSDSGLRLNSKD